jgi:nucleoside-diphosphate-sugar epimerase
VDVVFHAGGATGLAGPWDYFCGVNFWGTRHVVDGCLKHGVGRLVFTSSPSVTFDGSDQCGVDESVPYAGRWLCHYAHTKALAERHVLAANGLGELRCCALRPHLLWGPRDRHLVPQLLARARAGRLRRVGDGGNLIDLVYVENAAQAHLLAAGALTPDSPVAGRAYFIGQGEPVSCWRWIDQVLALGGLPPVSRAVSLAAAWTIGAAYEWLYGLLRRKADPPMTRFLAAQLARSHYFDISRARRDFGYCPQVSMAEGMRRLGGYLTSEEGQTANGRQ